MSNGTLDGASGSTLTFRGGPYTFAPDSSIDGDVVGFVGDIAVGRVKMAASSSARTSTTLDTAVAHFTGPVAGVGDVRMYEFAVGDFSTGSATPLDRKSVV